MTRVMDLGWGDGFYVQEPLSNGGYLYVEVYNNSVGVYNLAMIADKSGLVGDDLASSEEWDREGQPTGPGGTEVFGKMPEILESLENAVPPGSVICVGAVTRKLFRIYERFLTRRGYIRVAGEMLKVVQ